MAAKENANQKTSFPHVEFRDVNDDGIMREVGIIKEWKNGSYAYLDIALLSDLDKGRLKKILSDVHADKDPLFEVMSRHRLSNGMNALDYFHPIVRTKRMAGHINTIQGGGLDSVRAVGDKMIGSDFANPSEGEWVGNGSTL